MGKLFELEKIRFIIAGCTNTGFDFVLLNSLVFIIGAFPVLANSISVSIGIVISYFLNHYFVFRSKSPISYKKFLSFFVVTGFSSLIIQGLIIYGFEVMTASEWGRSLFLINQMNKDAALELNIAKAVAVSVGMVWNFMLYKYVIFKDKLDKDFLETEEDFQK
ncbi:TPA: GtrA family protein [Candidatus Saccharibacteria bacterium]|nr:MAG: hypothetical protein UW38_C0001G0719 [Candidatus Saccharibacteria bacterium GW2011_GWC2_44_17]OGL33665.1 MAG: hypothetical protein A3E20_02845 [Candidatus Saccharibacteria bacterium RIFCSPHIGHO2_12_FULL_47_16]HBH77206.1 GtrA family protein [Candidatus Saccharibacteria bacterium]